MKQIKIRIIISLCGHVQLPLFVVSVLSAVKLHDFCSTLCYFTLMSLPCFTFTLGVSINTINSSYKPMQDHSECLACLNTFSCVSAAWFSLCNQKHQLYTFITQQMSVMTRARFLAIILKLAGTLYLPAWLSAAVECQQIPAVDCGIDLGLTFEIKRTKVVQKPFLLTV